MDYIKKLKDKRGMTLVEVLLVVGIMTVMLALAMPNLISESQAIRRAAMDDNARAVAVAVQSRLFSLKNAASASDADYYTLADSVAVSQKFDTEGAEGIADTILFVSNFAYGEEKSAKTREILLSGFITDTELLEKGKIVIGFERATANVLYVFYSEKEFDTSQLFPTSGGVLSPSANGRFLERNYIGLYRGEFVPPPSYKVGLPDFTIVWRYDEDMYLEMQLAGTPNTELLGKNLGIEVFALIPSEKGREDEVLIYAEGMFENGYGGTIKPDVGSLTVNKIMDNGGKFFFAFDSLITAKAGYGNAQSHLRHQSNPSAITVADSLLYPRETVANWFNKSVNPYLDYWEKEYGITSGSVYDRLHANAGATSYIDVDETVRLRVELHVLSSTRTHHAKGDTSAIIFDYDDDTYAPVTRLSENVSPYFYALSDDANTVVLSSLRDLNNLSYVFEDLNSIDTARLGGDIKSQSFYDKLVSVRYALFAKDSGARSSWAFANWDYMGINTIWNYKKEKFTLSGTKSAELGGGSYRIICPVFGGRDPNPGGLFHYAENCTFEDLDIVNPKVWKNGSQRTFIKQEDPDDPNRITRLDMGYADTVSGALVGVAYNCTFRNVRAYIDMDLALQQEVEDNPNNPARTPMNITQYRITGDICGGLVGLAIGGKDTPTTFTDCAASVHIGNENYYAAGELIYAGGLVGLAYGNVQITDSYAASQMSGYYTGGLVGGIGQGNWKFFIWNDKIQGGIPNEEADAEGDLTIKDSFAAGYGMFGVRVGGGLVAHVPDKDISRVKASGSYSAIRWRVFPSVAYGTFNGDTANYYVYQQNLDVPITANVVARFNCTGDALSAFGQKQSGIPCSQKMLAAKFEGKEGWTSSAGTAMWWWAEIAQKFKTSAADDVAGDSEPYAEYPFPMPVGNNDFYGMWNKYYDAISASDVPAFTQTLEDFYVLYYWNLSGDFKYIDPGQVRLYKIDKTAGVNVWIDGKKLTDGVTYEDGTMYYAMDALLNGVVYGQGADGATKISVKQGTFQFEGAPYYLPGYNAVKGSEFLPEGDNIEYFRSVPLLWDYYGYYFIATNNENAKYYIAYSPDIAPGKASLGDDKTYSNGSNYRVGSYKKIYVNENEFKTKLGYKTFNISASAAKLDYDAANGCFYVK